MQVNLDGCFKALQSFLFNTSASVNIDICPFFSVFLFPSDEHVGVSVCLLNV